MDIVGRGINTLEGIVTCLETCFPFHSEDGLRESCLLSKASLPSFEPGLLMELIEGLAFPCGAEIRRQVVQSRSHSACERVSSLH